MRTDDIVRIYPTTLDRTDEIYLPTDMGRPIPAKQLPTEILRRGLCQKSGGKVEVCKTCTGGCRFGREMVRRMENENSL